MHIFLRLFHEVETKTYSEEEKQQINELFSSAPGVEYVKSIALDGRGGYALTLEVSKESLDELVEFISSHGFLPAI